MSVIEESQPNYGNATAFAKHQHSIDTENLDSRALEVVDALHEAGFQALLVGGCVRDLLLGIRPKDFDVATDATPEEVRRVFRRSRIIGRRFRIVHVRFGRDIIEVSTFRRGLEHDEMDLAHSRKDLKGSSAARSSRGILLRDNTYGSLDEDAMRRDFTINALYYDPRTETLAEFANGLEDLEAGRLRLIGDPVKRFREDPVRILRAIRFAAKLDFEIEPETEAAIPKTVELIGEIPAARLFDEVIKLLLCGSAEKTWVLLRKYGLTELLFPSLKDHTLPELAMISTDNRVRLEKPVTPGFIYAVLLWPGYLSRRQRYSQNMPFPQARDLACNEIIAEQQPIISIPRRFSQFIRDVWNLQPRLERRQPRTIERLLSHPKFRAAYDFLLLRADAGEVPQEQAVWWTNIQTADSEERSAMIRSLKPPKKRQRRGA